ncbi:MAG: MCE family protein [Pirellulaceae bacterium]|nr:MCE family protein [Pirellulaceae bacterium]
MDERVIQFRVGVVVVAAASITLILVMLFGALPTLRPRYTLHIRFPEAPGVTIDSPVRKSGVQIGRVSNVKLLEQGGVVISMRVDKRFPLRRNEVCRIGSDSLVTGDAVLEWVNAEDRELSTELLTDGEFLANGEVSTDPFQVLVRVEQQMLTTFDSIQSAAGSIEVAGGEVALMVRNLNTAVGNNEEQMRRILQKAELSLDSLQASMDGVREVFDDPQIKDGLRRSMEDLPRMFESAQRTLDKTQTTLDSFQRVADSAHTNLRNLEGFTQPLAEQGPQLLADVSDTLNNVDALLIQLTQFSRALNDEDSTVGKLVHDRELYDRLNRAVANVEEVSRQLRPIAADVRIFTDKVARDPSSLIKGALDRRSPGMGLKSGASHAH